MNPYLALWCSSSIAIILIIAFKALADIAEMIGANDDGPYK